MEGRIFDIQGHSLHDGPGCRTTVFLSGCPLRCSWCANPEGLTGRRVLMVRASLCRSDGYPCAEACPHGAVRIADGRSGPPEFDRTVCASCDGFECVAVCPSGALAVSGRLIALDELLRVLDRDRDYWGTGGGVTFSGGEPLAQPEFLLAALEACRSNYIHTVVETSAHADASLVADVARLSDWIFVDLKQIDSSAHRRGTGVGNERILANLEVLAAARCRMRVVVRIPIVPSFNDSVENLTASARFLAALELREVNLLPFHRMAESKYAQLGMTYPYASVEAPSSDALEAHRRIFVEAGLACHVGSETPF